MPASSSHSDDRVSIASLRYYDYPALRWAVDQWWTTLKEAFARQGLENLPQGLNRDGGGMDAACQSPDLIFGQTCGFPLMHELKDHVQIVATPHYRSDYCEGPYYRSVILVRASEHHPDLQSLAGSCVAVNGLRSFSGYIALLATFMDHIAAEPFFGQVVLTGNHLNSIKAISAGDADCCACDCVSYEMIRHLHPDLYKTVSVVAAGPLAPGLPYVTAIGRDQGILRRLRLGLLEAMEQRSAAAARHALLLDGIAILTMKDYEPIVDLANRLSDRDADLLLPADRRDVRERYA